MKVKFEPITIQKINQPFELNISPNDCPLRQNIMAKLFPNSKKITFEKFRKHLFSYGKWSKIRMSPV